ncbi:DNA polymerase III subunit beta [Spirulina major CS-329]|uniref:DNA polymerase III subunit beta n=1 Tax=Spirulina TaxID=1154 RepID=UPI00232CB6F5|nr:MULTISPECIES: DNA polymerase III subunit beta [Spirulina]MDB9496411.1 DNA polymerase III subunit beta [Spirulina subsalsa CS-330]MDB9504378.1 DNA polymerase III subunit beta [Spirulina major CS-329]
MKLVCSQSDLNSNLSLVSRAVPARPSHPVLGNVLLIADESKQRIRLRGFDLSLGIETSFPAQVTQSGDITLPAKTLGDIISRLPDGEITLTHEDDDTDEGGLVTLTSTSGRYQLRSLNAEDFPELPTVDDGDSILLPVESLAEGLRSTLFAASTEETKQVLTGVHVTLGRDAIEFAATDGHRLAVLETPNDRDDDAEANTATDGLEVTIPARALRELERMLGLRNKEDGVTLHIDAGQVVFELGDDLKLTSRKLEGAYPAYRQLLPTQFSNQVNVDRRKFQSALERIAVLADSRNNVVRCTIDQERQQVQLSVESQDVGSGRESMDATVSSDTPKEIAFNVKYLMDGLKALSSSEITIHLNSPTQPVIFTPLSGLKMTYLAMPVQLRD